MKEKLNQIHEIIKELYPDAVSVTVFVNNEGLEVSPKYRANLTKYSMETITGNWINRTKQM